MSKRLPDINLDILETPASKLDLDLSHPGVHSPKHSDKEIKKMVEEDTVKLKQFERNPLEELRKLNERLADMIMAGWGTQALHQRFLKMLFFDTEGRQGFPFEIADLLMDLHVMHQEAYGFHEGFKTKGRFEPDVW